MAIHSCPSPLLLLLIAASLAATTVTKISPSSAPSPPAKPQLLPLQLRRQSSRRPSPPPPSPSIETVTQPPDETTEEQLRNIIDALIGAGDFGNWASVVSGAILPLSATLFVPENEAVPIADSGTGAVVGRDPFMLPYHVVPQRLTFPELVTIRTGARLPTLLPGKTVVITNNSRLNFTIDGSPITMPDLYSTDTFTVHGVGAVFDYSIYGDELDAVPKSMPDGEPGSGSDQSEVSLSPPDEIPAINGFPGISSDAAPLCPCVGLPLLFLAVYVVLGFKIHWNSYILKT